MTLLDLLGGNWRSMIPFIGAEIALVIAATICGAIVGSERERHEKPAGLRTLILVCLGSAIFTMSSYFFNTETGDSGRVAAQIVAGVGFLGAGVILHGRGSVSGTTTAATIWMTAAIGVVVGAGYAAAAIGLSVLARLVLTLGQALENHWVNKQDELHVDLEFEERGGKSRVQLERILVGYDIASIGTEWSPVREGSPGKLTLRISLQRRQLRELLDEVVALDAVRSIRQLPSSQRQFAGNDRGTSA
jgi:putative Mg2+ transporter-C (MgtC) family protein